MSRKKSSPVRYKSLKRVLEFASPGTRRSVKRPTITWDRLLARTLWSGGFYFVDKFGDMQWDNGVMCPATPDRWPVRKLIFE